MRNNLRNQISELNNLIFLLSSKVENIFIKAVNILENLNIKIIKEILESESEINNFSYEVETKCLGILGLQHPMASDLRIVTSYLKIIGDFERISDQCTDICEIISMGNLEKSSDNFAEVVNMLKSTFDMFQRVIKVFFDQDAQEAKNICKSDDNIDKLFSKIIFNISSTLSQDLSKIKMGTDLMFIAKYSERIADHCTNIAEWIIFIATGVHPMLN